MTYYIKILEDVEKIIDDALSFEGDKEVLRFAENLQQRLIELDRREQARILKKFESQFDNDERGEIENDTGF